MPQMYFVTTAGAAVTGTGITPDGTLPAGALVCSSADAAAAGPWSSIVNGALVVGAPPQPTPAAQAAAALTAGLAVTSAGTPALNGTYAVDATAQSHLSAEMIALLASGGKAFADGGSTVVWPDMAGANHTFTAASFQAFALAIGAYVATCFKVINGTSATLPAASATIP